MIGLLRNNIRDFFRRYREEQSFRVLINSSISSFLIRILGMGTGFLVALVTSRFYGASAYGTVAICMAILSFASVIGKLGMDVSLMRYIAEFSSKKNFNAVKHIYITAWRFILPIAILIVVFLFFTSSFFAEHVFHKPYLQKVLQLNSLFILPLIILLINSESIRGVEKIRTYTFLQTSAVSVFATLLLLVSLLFTNEKYVPVYVQFVSISLAAVISLILWLRYSHWSDSTSVQEVHYQKLLRTSSPMFITTIMQLIMSWAGTLIMASYYSEAETGVYNAIVRISTFMNISVHAINSIAAPRFASAYATGKADDLKQLSKETTRMIFLSTLPVFLVLFLFPHFILSVFGKDFTGHENALMLLLVGQLFVSFAGLSSQILNMADREKFLRNNAIISAVANVVACLVLIPLYGVWGAAIAQVIGMVVWNVLCILSVRAEFHFNTFFSFRSRKKV